MGVIVQRLEKRLEGDLPKAIMYFSILSTLNKLKLTERDIEVLAFTSIKGTITSPAARKEFVEIFDSSKASLENIKGKLVKLGWIVKIDNKYKIHPNLHIDFSKDIILQLKLIGNETTGSITTK